MARLRKVRKQKKFRYNVNRKRLDKKERGSGKIKCPEIQKVWERNKTMTTNLKEIGLAYDPNKVIKIPNAKEERIKYVKKINGFYEEDNDKTVEPRDNAEQRPKGFVMTKMEEDANALRQSHFRLPKGIISLLSYMMDKYKLNYKAMARDFKNYDQWTWKQFRAKIRTFIGIDVQFDKFLQERNLTDICDWKEYDSDGEW